jgi:hypothetical protein
VPPEILGRTNRSFPKIWYQLVPPVSSAGIDDLAEFARGCEAPVDVSISPALWGGKLRGSSVPICCASTTAFELATDSTHAADLVQAHLIEVLSCLGRECVDFYLLRLRKMLREDQLSGALEAIEAARSEGHIGHIGLFCDGPALPILAQWQIHDAFELVVCTEAEIAMIGPFARARRVGLVRFGQGSSEVDVQLTPISEAI